MTWFEILDGQIDPGKIFYIYLTTKSIIDFILFRLEN